MKSYPHKRFFQEPTVAQIKRECSLTRVNSRERNLVERVLSLEEGEAIVTTPLFPERIGKKRIYDSREFVKHAPEVEPSPINMIRDWIKRAMQREDKWPIPLDFRRYSFDRISQPYFGGYSFNPFPPGIRGDNRVRRVSLVECLEGARLYSYVNQVSQVAPVKIGDYTSCREVEEKGAVVPVEVPSRTQHVGRYKFKLTSVPVIKNRRKFRIGWNVGTEGHDCERKRWHFRYKGGSPTEEQVFCAHEIAAYRAFADHMWLKSDREHTPTPYVMSQFVQPSERLINVYRRALDSLLIFDRSLRKGKGGLRTTNKGDEEVLLWMAVQKYGHDDTCFRVKGEKKLMDEDWSLRYIDSKK